MRQRGLLGRLWLVLFGLSCCALGATWSAAQDGSGVEAAPETVARDGNAERPERAPADSWITFRGNWQGTGATAAQLPDSPERIWNKKVEKGAFEASAALIGNWAVLGDLDGRLYGLDLKTGEERWKLETGSGFMASPTIHEGRVYIGDIDGRFYAVELETGKVAWTFEAKLEIDAAATLHAGKLLVGSQDATLYCLDTDGKVVWEHKIDDQIRCSPIVVEGRAFVAGCDGFLHILDLESGKAIAKVEIGGPTGVTPAVVGDRLYLGTEDGAFLAIDWRKAEVLWRWQEPRGQGIRSCPALSETLVFFGTRGRQMVALDQRSGEVAWTFDAKRPIDSSPVLVGDRLYFGAGDGRVYGLNAATGEKQWEFEVGQEITASPAVVTGTLVIPDTRGGVHAFGRRE